MAFYKEDVTTDDSGKRLHYLSCDSNCFSDGSWNTLNFGLDREVGDGADIALDSQDRPRIAYLDGSDNLRYSWCNTGCESGANWQHGTVETGPPKAKIMNAVAITASGGRPSGQPSRTTQDNPLSSR